MVYTRTIHHEQQGSSTTLSLTGPTRLPLPSGPGGARLINITGGGGSFVILPDARLLRKGPHIYTVRNFGAVLQNVMLGDGVTYLTGIPAGWAVDFHLRDNTTVNGSWLADGATASAGVALSIGRTPMRITITESTDQGVQLNDLVYSKGYDGSYPLALTVEILAGVNLGAVTNPFRQSSGQLYQNPTLNIGAFCAGTTVLLINRGNIYGYGGRGANGRTTTGLSGGAGGNAIVTRWPFNLINYGLVAGGGGGGGAGGGGVPAGTYGGVGGGGAGYQPGFGGSYLTSSNPTGLPEPGTNANVLASGQGTTGTSGSTGGQGGYYGAAGSSGTAAGATLGGTGGAAGYAIRAYDAAIGGVNIIVGGTRYGPEIL